MTVATYRYVVAIYQKFKKSGNISEADRQAVKEYINRRTRLNRKNNVETFANMLRKTKMYAEKMGITWD